ncbi:histidine phosphatase family protein [Pseudobacteriovorax antillogorgiicola]|uniref:Probable phosphoglycerate mutase n=1 Tax=Pseudobacteriovorax antillogorgiicola TaxID=1513793 RepID=A0A1Y6B851_9BACT|nr:histidine phosphatase family protein [Pseudobacteriovorax antillogorgiicola]TCS58529.1 phosphoglycerate mutase [Pseudobacteriovorax antillogorgiicola]SME97920.1 probable phosphoglycerate mutase [Pseudobacteriovorax antillogorgiicola]
MTNKTVETEIYLLRHGQTVSNTLKRIQGQSDSSLTPSGLEQTERLAQRLAPLQFAALYSSPLGRAYETANVLGRYLDLKAQKEPRFQEISFGSVEGLTWSDVKEAHPELCEQWRQHVNHIALPDGESRDQAMERFTTALGELVQRHQGERIAIVTHGGVLAALFARILGIPSGKRPLCMIENASINILRYRDGWKIKTWGDVAHLP